MKKTVSTEELFQKSSKASRDLTWTSEKCFSLPMIILGSPIWGLPLVAVLAARNVYWEDKYQMRLLQERSQEK